MYALPVANRWPTGGYPHRSVVDFILLWIRLVTLGSEIVRLIVKFTHHSSRNSYDRSRNSYDRSHNSPDLSSDASNDTSHGGRSARDVDRDGPSTRGSSILGRNQISEGGICCHLRVDI
jgi:hypothetical protein